MNRKTVFDRYKSNRFEIISNEPSDDLDDTEVENPRKKDREQEKRDEEPTIGDPESRSSGWAA